MLSISRALLCLLPPSVSHCTILASTADIVKGFLEQEKAATGLLAEKDKEVNALKQETIRLRELYEKVPLLASILPPSRSVYVL
jgi:hypothetical protein